MFPQLSYIESALRSHYGVRDSRDLGHGPLHRLADLVQRQKALGGGGMSPICYESALFAKQGKSRLEAYHQTDRNALQYMGRICNVMLFLIFIAYL